LTTKLFYINDEENVLAQWQVWYHWTAAGFSPEPNTVNFFVCLQDWMNNDQYM